MICKWTIHYFLVSLRNWCIQMDQETCIFINEVGSCFIICRPVKNLLPLSKLQVWWHQTKLNGFYGSEILEKPREDMLLLLRAVWDQGWEALEACWGSSSGVCSLPLGSWAAYQPPHRQTSSRSSTKVSLGTKEAAWSFSDLAFSPDDDY